jgi:hypothetical protein
MRTWRQFLLSLASGDGGQGITWYDGTSYQQNQGHLKEQRAYSYRESKTRRDTRRSTATTTDEWRARSPEA